VCNVEKNLPVSTVLQEENDSTKQLDYVELSWDAKISSVKIRREEKEAAELITRSERRARISRQSRGRKERND